MCERETNATATTKKSRRTKPKQLGVIKAQQKNLGLPLAAKSHQQEFLIEQSWKDITIMEEKALSSFTSGHSSDREIT